MVSGRGEKEGQSTPGLGVHCPSWRAYAATWADVMGVADLGTGAQGDVYSLWQNGRSFLAWRSLDLATPEDPQGMEALLQSLLLIFLVATASSPGAGQECCSLWWEKRFNEVSGTTPFLRGSGNKKLKCGSRMLLPWERNGSVNSRLEEGQHKGSAPAVSTPNVSGAVWCLSEH